jgi:hypothetical protein
LACAFAGADGVTVEGLSIALAITCIPLLQRYAAVHL